jgi:hypothetical protein
VASLWAPCQPSVATAVAWVAVVWFGGGFVRPKLHQGFQNSTEFAEIWWIRPGPN